MRGFLTGNNQLKAASGKGLAVERRRIPSLTLQFLESCSVLFCWLKCPRPLGKHPREIKDVHPGWQWLRRLRYVLSNVYTTSSVPFGAGSL